jgi:hypothetical protein
MPNTIELKQEDKEESRHTNKVPFIKPIKPIVITLKQVKQNCPIIIVKKTFRKVRQRHTNDNKN